jgi:tRNA(Ile2) C34 agmatinyltransferase TiaS
MASDHDELDIELPSLPTLEKGPPPDCPQCGETMSFIDGDWACQDCNGESMGPETG